LVGKKLGASTNPVAVVSVATSGTRNIEVA
jgi:hypothetical protein